MRRYRFLRGDHPNFGLPFSCRSGEAEFRIDDWDFPVSRRTGLVATAIPARWGVFRGTMVSEWKPRQLEIRRRLRHLNKYSIRQ